MRRTVRPLVLGALGAGVLILPVCAGNVANLLTARGLYRAREFAIREALGASRVAIARLWLVELWMITVAAVVLGLAVAELAFTAAPKVIPAQYITLGAPQVSLRVGAGISGKPALSTTCPGFLSDQIALTDP